jgi:hypothetical protein
MTLAFLAVLGAELTLVAEEQTPWMAPMKAVAWMSVSLVTRRCLRRRWVRTEQTHVGRALPKYRCSVVVWALSLLPFVPNIIPVPFVGTGLPLELAIVGALRNMLLVLLAIPGRPDFSRLATVVGMVGMFATVMLTDGVSARVVVGAYAAIGAMWLAMTHWSGLCRIGGSPMPERPPLAAIACIVVFVCGATALGSLGPQRVAHTLGEWFPSSGGSLGEHPAARGGVGNGLDSANGGENAESTGFDGGDTFRESDLPSLYDVMTEVYGSPKPPDQVERAIALSPGKVKFKQGMKKSHSHKVGRSFALLRQSTPRRSDPRSVEADAMLYIKGRTPLHLRTVVYDQFDGVSWQEASVIPAHAAIQYDSDANWMCVDSRSASAGIAEVVEHEIKIGLFESSRIPAPLHVQRFRMGLVNEADFFSRSRDDLLTMIRRLPSATIVEMQSGVIVPDEANPLPFAPRSSASDVIYVHEAVARQAAEWGAGTRAGWPQVHAVIAHLQRQCTLDPGVSIESASQDPTDCFLNELRRGPAYQFASAATVMLYSLGYHVRLVSGFYASPARFDRRTQHTPVGRDDIHFWTEIELADGTWLTIEATPGYSTLEPTPPAWKRVLDGLASACTVAMHRPLQFLGPAMVAVALVALRRHIVDLVVTLVWCSAWARSSQELTLRTLWLLDTRCRLAGRPRPPAMTAAQWYGSIAAADGRVPRDAVRDVVHAANRAAFAPASQAYARLPEGICNACRQTVRTWTMRRLRRSVGQRSDSR